jgi:hypothetical protein
MPRGWPTPADIRERQREDRRRGGGGAGGGEKVAVWKPAPQRAFFRGAPPPAGMIQLASDTGAQITLLRIGPIDHQGGVGGWQQIERATRPDASYYKARTRETITIPCLIDVDLIPGQSLARRLRLLYRMGRPTGDRDEPPGIIIRGSAPAVRGTRWKLDEIALGADLETKLRGRRGGHVVRRIEVTLSLSEEDPAAEVERVRVKRSRTKGGKRKRRHYVVRQGDTLRSIAVRELGVSAGWQAIRAENKKKLPKHVDPDMPLRAGLRLELP